MMTTERPRPLPSRAASASNLRLYLVAFLATAYVMVWWLFAARAPSVSAKPPALELGPEASVLRRSAAWFDDLPSAERPVIEVPPGWQIVDQTARAPSVGKQAVSAPVRVSSPRRQGRIRTRSS